MSVTPISPEEMLKKIGEKSSPLPDYVIQAVNELIVEKYIDGDASIWDGAICARAASILHQQMRLTSIPVCPIPSSAIDWQQLVDVYKLQGWNVERDDTFGATTYIFSI